jgi:hypothetical protein
MTVIGNNARRTSVTEHGESLPIYGNACSGSQKHRISVKAFVDLEPCFAQVEPTETGTGIGITPKTYRRMANVAPGLLRLDLHLVTRSVTAGTLSCSIFGHGPLLSRS